MRPTASEAIARWALSDAITHLPAEGVELIKRAFIDTLAVTLLGARLDAPRIVAALEVSRSASNQASLVGMGGKGELLAAALVNGTSSHADLFDDNNAPMIAHPSGPLISALLPLAQVRSATGREVLQAYGAGFEVGVTLGRMLNPRLYEQGWHATRVLGVLGATTACCRLLRLDAERTVRAIGIATSMASGLRQNFGTMTMPLHVGLTARDAIHAALLAEAGFGADVAGLDGKYGFFQVFGNATPELPPLGQPFELMASGIIFKPYPSGAPTHAAVDAALELRERLNGDVSGISRITCHVHPWNAMTLREEEPQDPLQARVSMRYCIAAALRHGRLSYREFTEAALDDPLLRALMRRIGVRISNALPDSNEFPAEVEIETCSGEMLSKRCDVPPGGSTRPMSEQQLIAKFHDCAEGTLPPDAIEWVLAQIRDLDNLPAVTALCERLEGRPRESRP